MTHTFITMLLELYHNCPELMHTLFFFSSFFFPFLIPSPLPPPPGSRTAPHRRFSPGAAARVARSEVGRFHFQSARLRPYRALRVTAALRAASFPCRFPSGRCTCRAVLCRWGRALAEPNFRVCHRRNLPPVLLCVICFNLGRGKRALCAALGSYSCSWCQR